MPSQFGSVFKSFCELAIYAEHDFEHSDNKSFSDHFRSYIKDFRSIENSFEKKFSEVYSLKEIPLNLKQGMREGILRLCSSQQIREQVLQNPDVIHSIINNVNLNNEELNIEVDAGDLSGTDGQLLTSAIGFVLSVEQGISRYPVSEHMLENPEDTICDLISVIQSLSREIIIQYPSELAASEKKLIMSLFLQSLTVVIQREIMTCSKALLEQRLSLSISEYRSWDEFTKHIKESYSLSETSISGLGALQKPIKSLSIDLSNQFSTDNKAWIRTLEVVIYYQLLNLLDCILAEFQDKLTEITSAVDFSDMCMTQLKDEVENMNSSQKWASWDINWITQNLAKIAGTIQALITFPEQVDEELPGALVEDQEIDANAEKKVMPEDEYEELLNSMSSEIEKMDFNWQTENEATN